MQYHIDTHVHVYHCYDPGTLFREANLNSNRSGSGTNLILCLTESRGFNFFQNLKDQLKTDDSIAGWSLSEIAKQPAILLRSDDQNIIIVAGRQVVTKQGLEVHALFSEKTYDDGQDIQFIIDQINESGSIAVLPWGVGKWLGNRGAIIEKLLNDNEPGNLAIADISARPVLWPQPDQFRIARKSGFNCLYGTDPLPIDYEQSRIASAGMVMELPSDLSAAVAELKERLLKQTENHFYGTRVSVLRFIKDQLMLRLNRQSCMPGH
jgi:hypothetical protein